MSSTEYGSAYDYGDQVTKEATEGALAELDAELERMDKALHHLEQRLAPVTRIYSTEEKLASPKVEPASEIRRRIERLADQRRAVDGLTDRIDL